MFEIGNRVKLVSNRFGVHASNPVWGRKAGNIMGTVIKTPYASLTLPIRVKWDNGASNGYHECDLSLMESDWDR